MNALVAPAGTIVVMSSAAAKATRLARLQRLTALTPAERVALALRLGEEGLATFMASQGLDRATARRRIKAMHRLGRRRSSCAEAHAD